MQLVKFTGKTAQLMTAAAYALEAAKKEKNKHQKAEEAAKEVVARLLLQERQVNIDLLENKEVVIVQCDGTDTMKVERKESQRFDGKEFALLHPGLSEEFTRATPATYFDSLLTS